MINSDNNAEYTLPYFIENLNGLVKFIDSLDIQIIGGQCELFVYLKTMNKFVKWLFTKEKNFNRFGFNGKICAIFSAPKKYNDTIYLISKCGIRYCSNYMLCKLYEQQKTLATQKSSQGLFCCLFCYTQCKDESHRFEK